MNVGLVVFFSGWLDVFAVKPLLWGLGFWFGGCLYVDITYGTLACRVAPNAIWNVEYVVWIGVLAWVHGYRTGLRCGLRLYLYHRMCMNPYDFTFTIECV